MGSNTTCTASPNIAIVGSGPQPIPPSRGGAIENLVYNLTLENEEAAHPLALTVYAAPPDQPHSFSTDQRFTRWQFSRPWPVAGKLLRTRPGRIAGRIYPPLKFYPFFSHVLRRLRNRPPDLAVFENRPDIAAYHARRSRIPVVLHLHNEYHSFPRSEIESCLSHCKAIFTVSNFIGSQISHDFPKRRAKLITVHNGIDTSTFKSNPPAGVRSTVREQLGIAENDFVLVHSGRLVEGKGSATLLDILALLGDIPSVKVLFIGAAGYSGSPPSAYIRRLWDSARKWGRRVIFSGYIDYSEMPAYYQAADVAVFPFINPEPFGLVVAESLSMGVPVIATRSGGVPEIVTPDCGILVESNCQPAKIASVVRKLLSNPAWRSNLAQAGPRRIASNFTRKSNYDRFAAAVYDCVAFGQMPTPTQNRDELT
jgi:spore coat protein SA